MSYALDPFVKRSHVAVWVQRFDPRHLFCVLGGSVPSWLMKRMLRLVRLKLGSGLQLNLCIGSFLVCICRGTGICS